MLRIQQSVVRDIMDHVKRDAPIEACGYLAEKDGIVIRHYELTNMDASEVHFTMNPVEQFAAVRRMRAVGCKLRAVYHSHPSTPARPSKEDVRLAYDVDLSYVIVSLLDNNIKAFKVNNTELEKEEIAIIDN
ncbi:M67 family metallopeptidase [Thermodesulfobacteriota bacterium]